MELTVLYLDQGGGQKKQEESGPKKVKPKMERGSVRGRPRGRGIGRGRPKQASLNGPLDYLEQLEDHLEMKPSLDERSVEIKTSEHSEKIHAVENNLEFGDVREMDENEGTQNEIDTKNESNETTEENFENNYNFEDSEGLPNPDENERG